VVSQYQEGVLILKDNAKSASEFPALIGMNTFSYPDPSLLPNGKEALVQRIPEVPDSGSSKMCMPEKI